MFKDSCKYIFKNFERIKVLIKRLCEICRKNFLNKRHLLLEETDSIDWYYSSLNSFKNTTKIIFLQILYLLSPLWCPRIQNCSLGDTNFLPLYMFMLFFTVIKNVYVNDESFFCWAKFCFTFEKERKSIFTFVNLDTTTMLKWTTETFQKV